MANIYFDEDVLKKFSEATYNPLHNKLFGKPIRETGKTGLQTINFHSTKVSGQPLSMVNSNSSSGSIRGDIIENKIIFNNLKNVFREDEGIYLALLEQGIWEDHKKEIDYQALKHFYEQESGFLFGGEFIINGRSQAIKNPYGLFEKSQKGVAHLDNVTVKDFNSMASAIGDLVDVIEGVGEEVTELAMSNILYRKLAATANNSGTKNVLEHLKEQYPALNILGLLEFNTTGRLLAYNAGSDKYEAVRGISPFIGADGLSESDNAGVCEYRTVYKMTIGNNNFSKEAIFAERKVIIS